MVQGFELRAIAEALGVTTDYEFVEVYCADVAERSYRDFLKDKGLELKIGHDYAMVEKLEGLIVKQRFSPGAAMAYIKNSGEEYDTDICETRKIQAA